VSDRSWQKECEEAAAEWIEFLHTQKVEELARAMQHCESEIERLLFARLAFIRPEFVTLWPATLRLMDARAIYVPDDGEFGWLIPQLTVGKYRLDFAILYRVAGWKKPAQIAIECDGHDYHDGTKEAAERDKKRNRVLTAAGWKVLRFTGREIYRDPKRCAEEVESLLFDLFADIE